MSFYRNEFIRWAARILAKSPAGSTSSSNLVIVPGPSVHERLTFSHKLLNGHDKVIVGGFFIVAGPEDVADIDKLTSYPFRSFATSAFRGNIGCVSFKVEVSLEDAEAILIALLPYISSRPFDTEIIGEAECSSSTGQ